MRTLVVRLAIVGCVGFGLGVLSGCQGSPTVGVLRPASGEAEAYGKAIGHGVELAVAEARLGGHLPAEFKVIDVDTESKADRAAMEFRRLATENGVRLVVGGVTSEEARAVVKVAEEMRVICLSPSATDKNVAAESQYFYRMYPTDEAEGQTLARHLYDAMGVRKLMVFTDDSTWTRGVEAEMRQYFELNFKGKIVTTVHLDSQTWQRTSVDALTVHEPDAVFMVGHAQRILSVIEHLDDVGYDGIRSTTSTFYLSDVLGTAGDLADGVVFPLPPFDTSSDRESMDRFVSGYRERFDAPPDIFAASGYDAMKVAIHTLNSSEAIHTAELRNALSFGLTDFTGATGAISFNDYGEVRRYPVMHTVANGAVMTWARARELRLESVKDAIKDLTRSSEVQRRFRRPLPVGA